MQEKSGQSVFIRYGPNIIDSFLYGPAQSLCLQRSVISLAGKIDDPITLDVAVWLNNLVVTLE